MNKRVSFSNEAYFINDFGILETNVVTLKQHSYMTADYDDGLILGIDLDNNTVEEAMLQIENDINSVVFKGVDGEELLSESSLYTGCTIELYKNGEVIDKKTFVLVGDTNRDGQFDATDAVIVNCIVAGMLDKETVGADVYRAADADNSGKTDKFDADILRACGLLKGTVAQP